MRARGFQGLKQSSIRVFLSELLVIFVAAKVPLVKLELQPIFLTAAT